MSEAEEAAALSHAPVPPDGSAAYGGLPDQVVDFYRPHDGAVPARPAPLVLLLHGGAWRAPYDRWHISGLAACIARRGSAVASVEYRRGGPAAETFDDVAAAVDVVPRLAAATLGEEVVDPGGVVLSGHSAGGHLALWAAARHVLPPDSRWHRARPPAVRGVVALAPIADLASAVRLKVCSDAVVEFLGGPRAYADPAALLPTGIATTVVQGDRDTDVPPEVAERFVAAAAAAGEEVRLALLSGVGHFALIDPSAPACAIVVEEITRLAR